MKKYSCHSKTYSKIVASHFEDKHAFSNLNSLVELIEPVEVELHIVMAHTIRYYELIIRKPAMKNNFIDIIGQTYHQASCKTVKCCFGQYRIVP